MTGGVLYVLHGRLGSGSSAIEAAMQLSGLPHKTIYFPKREDGAMPPEILALNPLGQVPVLILPDGYVMTESAAILMHVADIAPEAKLAPAPGTSERAAFLRMMIFMAANTYMTELRYYYPHRYAGGENQSALVKSAALEEQARNWNALESMAANDKTLLATGFSVADLYMTMLASWSQITDFQTRWPKLHAIAAQTATNPNLSEIWQRNDVVF